MDIDKKLNIGFAGACLMAAGWVSAYWQFACVHGGCDYRFQEGTLRPLLWYFVYFWPILILLLFFNSLIFKKWLKSVASWYVPASIFVIS